MIGILASVGLLLGASLVFFRAILMVDRMGSCTCNAVAWAWVALGAAAFWVICATLTGLHLGLALAAFVVAVGAVLIADRRFRARRPTERRPT